WKNFGSLAAANRRSPCAKGMSVSAVPWVTNTGRQHLPILSRLAKRLRIRQRAGSHGYRPWATAGADVNVLARAKARGARGGAKSARHAAAGRLAKEEDPRGRPRPGPQGVGGAGARETPRLAGRAAALAVAGIVEDEHGHVQRLPEFGDRPAPVTEVAAVAVT